METTDRSAEHAAICKELTELYARKNHDYGDSFHITYQNGLAFQIAVACPQA